MPAHLATAPCPAPPVPHEPPPTAFGATRHARSRRPATPRARARARRRRTPLFAYFIGVSPRPVFATLTCGPVPEPDDLTRTPGSVRFPVCLDLIARPRRSALRAFSRPPPSLNVVSSVDVACCGPDRVGVARLVWRSPPARCLPVLQMTGPAATDSIVPDLARVLCSVGARPGPGNVSRLEGH
jgi:hypothetical protein